MRYMSKKEFSSKMRRLQYKNEQIELQNKLKAEKNKHKFKFKLPSTSKLVLLVIILMCIEILIFSQYAMIRLGDVSALYAMIGVPATLIPIVWAYFSKSKAENTAGGIVFETAMREQENAAMQNMQNENANSQDEDMSGDDAVG